MLEVSGGGGDGDLAQLIDAAASSVDATTFAPRNRGSGFSEIAPPSHAALYLRLPELCLPFAPHQRL